MLLNHLKIILFHFFFCHEKEADTGLKKIVDFSDYSTAELSVCSHVNDYGDVSRDKAS